MDIDSAKQYIFELVHALPKLFSNVKVEYEFGEGRPFIGDDSIEDFRGMLGGHSLAGKSGLYLFTTENNYIIYIGKATKNNLHSRITSHLGTPKRLETQWMTFPSAAFTECPKNPELIEKIQAGKIRLHVFSVSDANLVSMIEVYMQTIFLKIMEELPWLNKQIG